MVLHKVHHETKNDSVSVTKARSEQKTSYDHDAKFACGVYSYVHIITQLNFTMAKIINLNRECLRYKDAAKQYL